MARRSVDVSGFRVTVDVPERVCRPIRSVVRRATRRSTAGSTNAVVGQLVVGGAPQVRLDRRDPDAGVAFIRDRVEWRAANSSNGSVGNPTNDENDASGLARAIAGHPWYHTIELPHGVVTSGYFDHRPLVPLYGIPEDLHGKRVLDVGTADGFWAFEFERRGSRVTAVDIETTADVDLPRDLRLLAGARGWADPLGDGFEPPTAPSGRASSGSSGRCTTSTPTASGGSTSSTPGTCCSTFGIRCGHSRRFDRSPTATASPCSRTSSTPTSVRRATRRPS